MVRQWKEHILGTWSKKASKSVCISTIVVYPDFLYPSPSPSWVVKTPENTEENPNDPEPADERDI